MSFMKSLIMMQLNEKWPVKFKKIVNLYYKDNLTCTNCQTRKKPI